MAVAFRVVIVASCTVTQLRRRWKAATAMVMWIMFGATMFVGLYVLQGGQQFVADALQGTGLDSRR